MEPDKLPSAFDMPAFRVERNGLAYVFGSLGGLVAITELLELFIPLPEKLEDYPLLRVGLIALLVILTVVSLLYSWLKGVGDAAYGRLREYPKVHQVAERESKELSTLRQDTVNLIQLATSESTDEDYRRVKDELRGLKKSLLAVGVAALNPFSFYIERAGLEKGKLVIEVKDKEGSLQQGDKLMVVDTQDFYHMGSFTMNQERVEECMAVGGSDVDILWRSAVRDHGEGHLVASKIAILVGRSNK